MRLLAQFERFRGLGLLAASFFHLSRKGRSFIVHEVARSRTEVAKDGLKALIADWRNNLAILKMCGWVRFVVCHAGLRVISLALCLPNPPLSRCHFSLR